MKRDQLIVFSLLYIAYCVYYLCKKNYPFWLDAILTHTSITTTQAGLIGSSFELVSGASKVLLAVFVDTHSASAVLAGGLLLSTFMNLFVAIGATYLPDGSPLQLFFFVLCWGINGTAQGIGWPALARIFLAWFPDPAKRGFWYSLLSTNQNVGGALVPVLLTPAISAFGWKASLYVPAVIGFVISIILYLFVQDEPSDVASLEAPPTPSPNHQSSSEKESSENSESSISTILFEDVVKNPAIWMLSSSYFFVSIARNGLGDWAILLLNEVWGFSKIEASECLFLLELGGFLGGLLGGYVSDRIFHGRRAPVIGGFSFLIALPVLVLSLGPSSETSSFAPYVAYFFFGVFSFAPHVLIGLTARELTRTVAQSTAGGVVKFLGQLGGAMAGAPLGATVVTYGWTSGLQLIVLFAIASGLSMIPLWYTVPPKKRTKKK